MHNETPLKTAYFQRMVLRALMILITRAVNDTTARMSPTEQEWLRDYEKPESDLDAK